MMVLFTSRSEKKALLTTRQILDSFADRIGNDTWRTVITQEGLLTVKNLLRRSATKNTAVACHWLRSRSHSQLLWIVGSRSKYDETGRVPVNTTAKNLSHHEWEQGWPSMPPLKALTALAALFHDWGKASDYFQKKLQKNDYKADPLRHEWISVKLISALVTASGDPADDEGWLSALSAEDPKNKKDSLEKKFSPSSRILLRRSPLLSRKTAPRPRGMIRQNPILSPKIYRPWPSSCHGSSSLITASPRCRRERTAFVIYMMTALPPLSPPCWKKSPPTGTTPMAIRAK